MTADLVSFTVHEQPPRVSSAREKENAKRARQKMAGATRCAEVDVDDDDSGGSGMVGARFQSVRRQTRREESGFRDTPEEFRSMRYGSLPRGAPLMMKPVESSCCARELVECTCVRVAVDELACQR